MSNWSYSIYEQNRLFDVLNKKKKNLIMDFAVSMPGIVYLLHMNGVVTMSTPYSYEKEENNTKWRDLNIDLFNPLHSNPISVSLARNSVRYPTILGENGCLIWKKKKNGIFTVFKAIEGNYTGAEWSFDGRLLALWSCFSSTFYIFDAIRMSLMEYSVPRGGILQFRFSKSLKYAILSTTISQFMIFDLTYLKWEQWTVDGGVSWLYISKDDDHYLIAQRHTAIIYHFYSNGYNTEEPGSGISEVTLADLHSLSSKGYLHDTGWSLRKLKCRLRRIEWWL